MMVVGLVSSHVRTSTQASFFATRVQALERRGRSGTD